MERKIPQNTRRSSGRKVWRNQAVHQRIGIVGERAALQYLRKSGMTILAQNWSCRLGEIDIVAREKDELVIVEVKTRMDSKWAERMIFETLTRSKKTKLLNLSQRYLNRHFPGRKKPRVRIDVIGIILTPQDYSVISIEHLIAAVEA